MADCIFCSIAGDARKAGTADSEFDVINFEPLSPVVPGHRLFVPTVHVSDAADRPYITGIAARSAAQWAKEAGTPGNLITSIGEEATQTVMHLHWHWVPREAGDGLHLPWTGQVKP